MDDGVTLLPGQRRTQQEGSSAPPLRMLILGEGGAGKSGLIRTLRRLFRREKMEQSKRFEQVTLNIYGDCDIENRRVNNT